MNRAIIIVLSSALFGLVGCGEKATPEQDIVDPAGPGGAGEKAPPPAPGAGDQAEKGGEARRGNPFDTEQFPPPATVKVLLKNTNIERVAWTPSTLDGALKEILDPLGVKWSIDPSVDGHLPPEERLVHLELKNVSAWDLLGYMVKGLQELEFVLEGDEVVIRVGGK